MSEKTPDISGGIFMLLGFLTMAIAGSIYAFQNWGGSAGAFVVGLSLFVLGATLSRSSGNNLS
jgi:VIT1/CCC1 family predicted Fe2+/Mn2+ transporter